MRWTVRIPVERTPHPLARLVDQAALEEARREGRPLPGLEVAESPEGAEPILGLGPEGLVLSDDGEEVHVVLAASLVVNDYVERLYAPRRPAWLDGRGDLSEADVVEFLELVGRSSGRKKLVPYPHERYPGLCSVSVMVPEPTATGANAAAPSPRNKSWTLFTVPAFRVPFARVVSGPSGSGSKWVKQLFPGSRFPVEPLAELIGVPRQRCRPVAPRADIPGVQWMAMRVALRGAESDAVVLAIRAEFVTSTDGALHYVGRQAPECAAHVEAVLRVARAWPGEILLCRTGIAPGASADAWVYLSEHPGVPEATGPLARAALQDALQGRSEAALREWLRQTWDDRRTLEALYGMAVLQSTLGAG